MGTPFYGIWNRAKGDIIPETLQEVCGDRLLGQVPTDDEIESFDYKRLDPRITTNHYISFSILNSQFKIQHFPTQSSNDRRCIFANHFFVGIARATGFT